MNVRLLLATALLSVSLSARAADHKLAIDAKPPEGEALSAEIRDTLAENGMAVSRGSRKVCTVWFTKKWATKPDFAPSQTVLYPFQVGELIGVVEYKSKGEDFRGQPIAPGTYTMRYAQQPVDGNHVGTSDTRDFVLLVPAADDATPAPLEEIALWDLSKKASKGAHPSILCLLASEGEASAEPVLDHDEGRDLWLLEAAGATAAGDKPLPLALVVVGKAAE